MSIVDGRPLHAMTLVEQSEALAAKEVSSVELTEHYLARIEQHDGVFNSFVSTDHEQSLDEARKADAARASGEQGALLGIPLAHKDIFCTLKQPTTCGSRMLEGYVSPYEATVVTKLYQAGMVTLGKANMDEFAMGSSNENSYYGAVDNPWKAGTVPGGSSGGSAAAVAARLAPVATATDTGGSIRQPAAFCGVTGIKPTYGRISRYGMIAYASSLDQGGVIAATAADCALVLEAMSGADPRDATCSNEAVPDWSSIAGSDAKLDGLRVGVPEEFFAEGLDQGVADAVRAGLADMEAAGATLVPISLPKQSLGISAYYVVAPAEASSNLSRFDGVRFGHRCDDPKDLTDLYERSRAEGFGPEVQRRILIGAYVLSAGFYDAYYKKAQQVRQLLADEFSGAFESVDVIAGPTTPTVAFNRGAKSDDPVAMYLNDLYTVSANLCGLPGLSMPCGFVDDLPVGLQLIARPFDETTLLKTAHAYQQVTDWHTRAPEVA